MFFLPLSVKAEEIDSLGAESQPTIIPQEIKKTKMMTQEEMDDLFGLDPYLGPTSWLDSKTNTLNSDKPN
tara:strand:- start:229 stop:438 length:210 start_codon:yes stop_codon:yes gene_type:complete